MTSPLQTPFQPIGPGIMDYKGLLRRSPGRWLTWPEAYQCYHDRQMVSAVVFAAIFIGNSTVPPVVWANAVDEKEECEMSIVNSIRVHRKHGRDRRKGGAVQ